MPTQIWIASKYDNMQSLNCPQPGSGSGPQALDPRPSHYLLSPEFPGSRVLIILVAESGNSHAYMTTVSSTFFSSMPPTPHSAVQAPERYSRKSESSLFYQAHPLTLHYPYSPSGANLNRKFDNVAPRGSSLTHKSNKSNQIILHIPTPRRNKKPSWLVKRSRSRKIDYLNPSVGTSFSFRTPTLETTCQL